MSPLPCPRCLFVPSWKRTTLFLGHRCLGCAFLQTLPKAIKLISRFLMLRIHLLRDSLCQLLEDHSELPLAVRMLCDLRYCSPHGVGVCNFLKSVALIGKVYTGQEDVRSHLKPVHRGCRLGQDCEADFKNAVRSDEWTSAGTNGEQAAFHSTSCGLNCLFCAGVILHSNSRSPA